MGYDKPKDGGPTHEEEMCKNCGKHKGTIKWLGTGGVMEFTHGMYEIWCRCCVLKAQLDYAKKESRRLTKRIPVLERKLKRVRCK